MSATFDQMRFWRTSNGDTFNMDFCRDGGFGVGGASSYTMAFFSVVDSGVQVTFDDEAPVVQWVSFGDLPGNKFDPKLVMKSSGPAGKYHVSLIVTEPTPDPVTGKCKELFSKKIDVDLPAGGSREAGVSFDLAANSKGIATYEITDEKGTVEFYRKVEFTTSNPYRHYQPAGEIKPLVVKAQMAPNYGRILAAADVISFPGDKTKLEVQATAYRDGDAAPIGSVTISKFPYDYGQGIIDVGKLTEGTYTVKFQALDKATRQPVGTEESVKLTRKVYEWENNNIGYSEKVPEPWTSMSVKDGLALCWGRKYAFDGLGLPDSILTTQLEPTRSRHKEMDVLAGPVKLVAKSAGREIPWKLGGRRFTGVKETQVDVVGSATADGLKAEVDGSLEYDGLYKIHLKITPTKPVHLDSLRVEVPMRTSLALLFNHCGESMRTNKTYLNMDGLKDGILWNSKDAAHNSMITGNFLPITWMGDDDRGIGWMCDNDRTWVTTSAKPCLDVIRKGEITSFRMHLLNKPGTLSKPIEVTFSLQGTPFRPRPAGGSWKQVEWYGWSQFDKPLIWDKCFDDYDKGEGYKWYRTPDAKEKDLWWRYFCFNSDRIPESDPTYGQIVKDFAAEWYVDAPLAFIQDKLHSDFILWAYKQWHDRGGLKGAYHDNSFPVAWPSLITDRGWIDDDGNLRAGYWTFAYRDFTKRERTYWLSVAKAPVMKTHMTDCPVPGYLGFCDFWLDGENGGYPDPSVSDPDFVDRWYNKVGMTNLRTTMGRQWGVIPQYLYNWGIDPTYAVLGQLDLDNCYSRIDGIGWNFGIDQADCQFMPFWDIRKPVRVTKGVPDVLVGTWSRPGRARILVSNCGNEARNVDVKLDTKLLGLPSDSVAVDEQTGDAVSYTKGTVAGLKVGRHNYRVVVIAAPGIYATVPSAAPNPADGRKIERLCSDFETTDGWKLLGSNIDAWNGMLRVRGKDFALASKTFGEDNCSVQVKVRGAAGAWGIMFSDAFPSVMLYWKKGAYVGMAAGYGQTDPVGRSNRSFYSVDGKLRQGPVGPRTQTVNWLRITLKPDAIEFYSSSDGKMWTKTDSIGRDGLNGAPAYIYVGRGTVVGPDELVQGKDQSDGSAYFDDLVTWR